MRQPKLFSFTPIIISLWIHIAVVLWIVLSLYLLSFLHPNPPISEQAAKLQEDRFRLSMKEYSNVKKEAVLNNHIPLPPKARPIPRGEQLSHITPQTPVLKPEPIETPQPQSVLPEPKKAFERYIAKPVATIDRQPQPKKEPGLYDILSRPETSLPEKPSKNSTKISNDIKEIYGDTFGNLSAGEQEYILDNHEKITYITQEVLNRYGKARIPDDLHIDDSNIISFYFYPDGSISDIRFLKHSKLTILDNITKETIEFSFAKYPRPKQKILLRYVTRYTL